MSSPQSTQEEVTPLKRNMERIKYKLMIISGKGGVGKTTMSVNLAAGLAEKGYRTGILDTDIHGPNVAKMLGIEDRQLVGTPEGGVDPVAVAPNLVAVSMALTGIKADQPLIWRGPMKMKAIEQLLTDINWGDLDFLIVDSPPGTGDEPLSVSQLIGKIDGAVIVTTPQDVAVLDSRRTIRFAEQLNIPILGIVENMSGLVCPHCQEMIDLFGEGGGQAAAAEYKIPFLGKVPMEPELVRQSDQGASVAGMPEDSITRKAIQSVIEGIESAIIE